VFNLEEAIADWERQMLAAGINTPEALTELETHLRDEVEHQIRSGLSLEQAFDSAVQQLGSADALKAEFTKTSGATQRHYIYCGLGFGIGLFLLGVAFCRFAVIPAALAASQTYSHWLGFSPTGWNPNEYISFVFRLMLGLGLALEIPVVLLTLVKIGVLDHRLLSKARKYVIVMNLILGAVLTTPELTTQLIMFLPLQILYEASVWIAWYWEAKRRSARRQRG
jgi:hypothetical protein